MKTLANLASDTPSSGSRKRRRGGNPDRDDDDSFGANDSDWGVYRTVANDPGGSGDPSGGGGGGGDGDDEEDEAEDLDAEMSNLESELLKYDPEFTEDHTLAAQRDWSKSLMHAFLRGPRPYDPESPAEKNQIHMNVERIRIPEVIFQPTIAGVDQAGLIDIVADTINHGNFATTSTTTSTTSTTATPATNTNTNTIPNIRDRLLGDIFLTGGPTLLPHFHERVARELRAVLPADSVIKVRRAKDPILDAWKGAAAWVREGGTGGVGAAFVTKAEWEERGSEYVREHWIGAGS